MKSEKQIKTLRLCNDREQQDYLALRDNIEKNNMVNLKDINAIVANIFMHRDKFAKVFTLKMICFQLLVDNFKCCVRKRKRDSVNWKYTKLINNGMHRYYNELDIVNLL